MTDARELAGRVRSGDVRALARAVTLVENGRPAAAALLRELYPHTGRATTLGITGFPGAGKSSLVDRLIAAYRTQGQSVGVIAVDPSSAFSGGAILGDRVRMMGHTSDAGVFIRSMATRGHLGGLSRATADVLDLFDASGRDVILVETVGVGQDEIDVARLGDVVVVVLVPGMGDDIQAIKAGILEIADLFVINKSDRDGADKLASELMQMMSLVDDRRVRPTIVKTVATESRGIAELTAAIDAFLARPEAMESRRARRIDRARSRLHELLARVLVERVLAQGVGPDGWERLVQEVAARQIDPYTAVERLLEPTAGAAPRGAG